MKPRSVRRGIRPCLGLLILSLAAPPTAPAEVVSPSAVHRLAEAARQRHPGLQALQSRAAAARENAEGVRQWSDPSLRAGGIGYTPRGPAPSEEGDIALGISQNLPVFGKESAARAVAQAESRTAQETLETRFQMLKRDLMGRALDSALLNRRIELAQADLAWLRNLSLGLEARLPSGAVSPAQLLRLRNEVSQAEATLRLRHLESRDAAVRIQRILGKPTEPPVDHWELPARARPIAYRHEWSRKALAVEPRLRLARRMSQEAEARVEATRLSPRPNLSLGLDSRQYSGDGGLRNGSATLSMSLPWFNRDQYRKDLARDRLRLEASQREVADLESEVAMEIHHQVTRIEATRIRAELAEETLIPRIRAAQEAATAALAGGGGDLREALDLRRQGLEASAQQADAIAEQWSAIAELLLVCGWNDLPETDATTPIPQQPR